MNKRTVHLPARKRFLPDIDPEEEAVAPRSPSAEALSAQYRLALDGVRNILIFGAMLNHLANVLQSQNVWGAENKGKGLRGWLAQNCPEINYKTAHKFLTLAQGMVAALALPEEADVPRLMGASEEELGEEERQWRERIDEAIDGKSMRQLEFDFGIRGERPGNWGGARPGAGRPKLISEDGVTEGIRKAAVAKWGEVQRSAGQFLAHKFELALTLQEIRAAEKTVQALADALARREAELKERERT